MEDEDDMAEPLWLQTADGHRRLRRRRQLSSIFLNSGLLLALLLLLACLLLFLIIPSFLSFTSQILRPHSVKKSWDSLNLLLVLFAVVCGFLSRNGVQRSNNEPPARTPVSTISSSLSSSSPQQGFGDYERYQDRMSHSAGGGGGVNRLRSFNSYPDLRQESLWSSGDGDDRWRFYDDTHLRDYNCRFPSSSDDILLRHRVVATEEEMEVAEVKKIEKEIAVEEKAADRSPLFTMEPPAPSVPAPSSPPKAAKRKVQRTYRSVGKSRSSDGGEEREMDIEDFYKRPPPSTSSRSPPQNAVSRRKVKRNFNRQEFAESIREEEEEEEEEEKKTVAEEIKYVYLPPPSPPPPPPIKKKSKDFLISLRRKKKKKQRQQSVDNLASLFDTESEFPPIQLESSIPPPASPPPPPPPQHFLQNLFSPRKGKSKKVHSVSLPAPSTEYRPSSTELHLSRSVRRSVSRAPSTEYRPSDREEIGNASPLIPIPPPPPPPPFNMPAWRFEVRGDYVRVASFNSSRSESPDLESEDPSDRESGGRESPLFCPSPDVDTKADNFIARFRAGLKLEKVKSNLGPVEGPN